MSLEKRVLLLDNRGKPILLKDIPNYLGADRVRDDVVDKMDSLDSIIQLSSSDFVMILGLIFHFPITLHH
jgi:hypothetical protein